MENRKGNKNEKKPQEQLDIIEEYINVKETVNQLNQDQQKLASEVEAAKTVLNESMGDQYKQRVDFLGEKISTLPETLAQIESNELKAVQDFVNKNRDNLMLAKVVQGEERLHQKEGNKLIRDKAAKQARENKKIAMLNEERENLKKGEFKQEFINAAFNPELEAKLYAELESKAKDRVAAREPELDKFEKQYRKEHKGNLSAAESKAAKKQIDKYLKSMDPTPYKEKADNLKNALANVAKNCADCLEEQKYISKEVGGLIQGDIQKKQKAQRQLTRKGSSAFFNPLTASARNKESSELKNTDTPRKNR